MAKRVRPAALEDGAKPSDDGQSLSSVVYVGHIPHGFYEKQMKEYFSQFGKVTKIRLSRNKKTGNSKHYAFVQFQSSDVAKIVADAMNGYMFFGQKLETRTLMKKEIHPELFKGANRVFKRIPWKKVEIERHNKVRSEEEITCQTKRVSRRNSLRAKRILEAGIDYEFPTQSEGMKPLQKEGIPKEKAKTRSRKVKENSKQEEECAKYEKDEKSKTALEGRNRSVKSSTLRKIDTSKAPDEDKSVEKSSARMTRGKRKLAEHEKESKGKPAKSSNLRRKTDTKT